MSTDIRCCGTRHVPGLTQALYACLDLSGNVITADMYGGSNASVEFRQIMVTGIISPVTYLAGNSYSISDEGFSYVVQPGQTPLVLNEPGHDIIAPRMCLSGGTLFISLLRDASATVLLRVDQNLVPFAGEILATNGDGCRLLGLNNYADGVTVNGFSYGLPPTSLSFSINLVDLGSTWSTVGLAAGNAAIIPTLSTHPAVEMDPPLVLNRDATEGDASFVFRR